MAKYELGDMVYAVQRGVIYNGFVASIIVKPTSLTYGIRVLNEEGDIETKQVNECVCFVSFDDALNDVVEYLKTATPHIVDLYCDDPVELSEHLNNRDSTLYNLIEDLPKAIECLTKRYS